MWHGGFGLWDPGFKTLGIVLHDLDLALAALLLGGANGTALGAGTSTLARRFVLLAAVLRVGLQPLKALVGLTATFPSSTAFGSSFPGGPA